MTTDLLRLIGRNTGLFEHDIDTHREELSSIVESSRFLVIGGAGSIGQAVSKELFKRKPLKLDIVDISENNLVELVRDIRSVYGYIDGQFRTFALDVGSSIYDSFIESDGEYDFVLNLTALKHVRSEKDPFTLMRMIDTNIINTEKTVCQSIEHKVGKYFAVSTDKAANPVNMMGASKRIMEMFLMRQSEKIELSTARFANVAFSDGSLLHSFNQRMLKRQPIVAPHDVKRYFVTAQESGELCLMSCLLGESRDIFFPKQSEVLQLQSFADIAKKYIESRGFEPIQCDTEDQARELAKHLPQRGQWPCLFTFSDTTGEKNFEEFYTGQEQLNMERFQNIGVIKNKPFFDSEKLTHFEKSIAQIKSNNRWSKSEIVCLFQKMLPEFRHLDAGKYLDAKM